MGQTCTKSPHHGFYEGDSCTWCEAEKPAALEASRCDAIADDLRRRFEDKEDALISLIASMSLSASMFGQSPAGLSATGDSDIRWFYGRLFPWLPLPLSIDGI